MGIITWLSDLEGLDEGPKEGSNPLSSAQQLDQSHDSEKPKEGDGDASAVLRVLWGAESVLANQLI